MPGRAKTSFCHGCYPPYTFRGGEPWRETYSLIYNALRLFASAIFRLGNSLSPDSQDFGFTPGLRLGCRARLSARSRGLRLGRRVRLPGRLPGRSPAPPAPRPKVRITAFLILSPAVLSPERTKPRHFETLHTILQGIWMEIPTHYFKEIEASEMIC